MKKEQELFTALFDSYENTPSKSINLKEIRARIGGLVKEQLTFAESKVQDMPIDLQNGDFTAFTADLEFNNIKFVQVLKIRRSL